MPINTILTLMIAAQFSGAGVVLAILVSWLVR
jgi:hypothetical protein